MGKKQIRYKALWITGQKQRAYSAMFEKYLMSCEGDFQFFCQKNQLTAQVMTLIKWNGHDPGHRPGHKPGHGPGHGHDYCPHDK